jgi:hypothetical protein
MSLVGAVVSLLRGGQFYYGEEAGSLPEPSSVPASRA